MLVGGRYVAADEYASWEKELEKAEKTMKNREEVGVLPRREG